MKLLNCNSQVNDVQRLTVRRNAYFSLVYERLYRSSTKRKANDANKSFSEMSLHQTANALELFHAISMYRVCKVNELPSNNVGMALAKIFALKNAKSIENAIAA